MPCHLQDFHGNAPRASEKPCSKGAGVAPGRLYAAPDRCGIIGAGSELVKNDRHERQECQAPGAQEPERTRRT